MDKRHGFVHLMLVVHLEIIQVLFGVDGLERLLGVQFPTVAFVVHAIPVVDAEGDVGRLLDFGEQHAFADGVHCAGRNHEGVAGLHGIEF